MQSSNAEPTLATLSASWQAWQAEKSCSTSSADSGVVINNADNAENNSNDNSKCQKNNYNYNYNYNTKLEQTPCTNSIKLKLSDDDVNDDHYSEESFVIDSESELEEAEAEAEKEEAEEAEESAKPPLQPAVQPIGKPIAYAPNSPELQNINHGLSVVAQQIHSKTAQNVLKTGTGLNAPEALKISNIELQNTKEVTFGDKYFYGGPVTIQQFLVDKSRDKSTNIINTSINNNNNGNGKTTATKSKLIVECFIKRKTLYIGVSVLLLLLLLLLLFGTFLCSVLKSETLNKYETYAFDGKLLIVPKADWAQRTAQAQLPELKLPLRNVIISHTASEPCYNWAACVYHLRVFQNYHMDSYKFSEIGYNFIIGGNGMIFEGRGWHKMGAGVKGYNAISITIAFVGLFTKVEPTKAQLAALELLLADGVRRNKLAKDYSLYAASQFTPTASPGEMCYKLIQKMAHWSAVKPY